MSVWSNGNKPCAKSLVTTSIMLLSNNTEINAQEVDEKLQAVCIHRRRTLPLFNRQIAKKLDDGVEESHHLASLGMAHFATPGRNTKLRGFVKQIPVVGNLIVQMHRRTRSILAPGLHWKQRLRLVPIIGSLSAWTYSIVRMNAVRHKIAVELTQLRHLQELSEINSRREMEQLNHRFDKFNIRLDQITDAVGQIGERLGRIDGRQDYIDEKQVQVGGLLDHLDIRLDKFDALQIEDRLSGLEVIGIEPILERLDSTSREMRRIIDAVLSSQMEAYESSIHGNVNQAPALRPIETVKLDSFYIEFEDTFRGTREDITERLKVYLPYLESLVDDDTAHVIDVGCGRGEWLALLTERGIKATGIDTNNVMVESCRDAGLQAECMDAIQYLQMQPEASLSAVTGFHIIEHLPFKVLLSLFDSALRALRPGGMIIFETPNPENLVVGSCNFYYDPTHLSPIVPIVADFMARQRGFASAEILRLHPYPESYRVTEDSELAKRFNDALYGPQDYAVLAWKNHAN